MATARQLDPTGTLTLRNRFVAEMDRRFRFLKAVIHDAVVGADIFGLVESKTFLVSSLASDADEFLITHAPRKTSQKRVQARLSKKAFAFETDQKKVEKFRGWLDQQAQAGILSIDLGATKFSSDVRWSDQYVGSAYRKGIVDGFIDTKKAAGSSLTRKLALGFGAMATGTAGEFLRDSFSRPIHADRVAMLYTRAYDELKGITAGMSAKIGSSLAQGMAEGRGPRQIASMMNKQVDLGLNRARVLARTEVIRAHAEGKLNTYESLGIQRVEAQVEFTTAKDTRVCARCRGLQGKLFSVGTGGTKIKEKPKPAPELKPKKVKRKVKAKKKAVRRRGGKTVLAKKKAPSFKGVVREGVARGDSPAAIRKTLGDLYHKKGITDEAFIQKSFEMKVKEVGRERKKAGVPTVPVKPKAKELVPRKAAAEAFRTFKSDEEAQTYGKTKFQDWGKGLTENEKDSLWRYQGLSYQRINAAMRTGKGKTGRVKEVIDDITSAINKGSLPDNLTVWRGFSGPAVKSLEIGAIIKDKAFVSTSFEKSTGEYFAKRSKGVLAEIRLPKGSKGAWMGAAGSTEEAEFLLPSNQQFRVVESVTKAGKRRIILEPVL